MDRKKFIIGSSLTAVSLTTFGSIIKGLDGEITVGCETTNDILGPYYRPDAPLRSDLTYEGLAGNRIILKGHVYRSDCITPVKDAVIEIWQCNTEGEYDNSTKDFRLRAKWNTNEKGEYSFKTIMPGKYISGKLYRPAHIHYRVTEKNSLELISQIYFKGDPNIAKDPQASLDKAKQRILQITPEDIKGNLTIVFDIYLKNK